MTKYVSKLVEYFKIIKYYSHSNLSVWPKSSQRFTEINFKVCLPWNSKFSTILSVSAMLGLSSVKLQIFDLPRYSPRAGTILPQGPCFYRKFLPWSSRVFHCLQQMSWEFAGGVGDVGAWNWLIHKQEAGINGIGTGTLNKFIFWVSTRVGMSDHKLTDVN